MVEKSVSPSANKPCAIIPYRLNRSTAVGVRLETDILGAVSTGIRSIMVLTGISSEADLQDSAYQPTWVMADICAVTKALREQSV